MSRRPASVTRFHMLARASIAAEQSNASPSGMDSVYILASRSRRAAASRLRFSVSLAGVISASAVTRGNPYSRAASAPINTNSTACALSPAMSRSGSSGAISDTPCSHHESAHLRDLTQPILRCHPKNPGNIIHHRPVNRPYSFELGHHVEPGRLQ